MIFYFLHTLKPNIRSETMKYSLKTIEIISFIIASLLGVILHFIYGWSGENAVAGLFFPVNESTWEHLKLIFFPILLVSIGEYFIFHTQYDNFICVKLLSALLAMVLTVVCFYTYQGVYGKNSDVMNILIYFLSMGAAYRFSYRALSRNKGCRLPSTACYWGFVILCFVFFIFSLFPPHIGLFASPV